VKIHTPDAYRAQFEFLEENNQVLIKVIGEGAVFDLRWTGNSNGQPDSRWIYSLKNWVKEGEINPAPEFFAMGDRAIFDDGDDVKIKTITISGEVKSGSVTVDTNNTYTFEGEGGFSGKGALLKKGSGTLILKNTANSYTGGTVIEGGTVQAVSSAAIGSGPISLNGNNIRLEVNSGDILASTLSSSGGNNTIVAPDATFSGSDVSIEINGGKLTLSAPITTVNGTISGNGHLVILGTTARAFPALAAGEFEGTLELGGGFSFTGQNADWSKTDIVVTSTTAPAMNFSQAGGTIKVKSLTFNSGDIYVGSGTGNNSLDIQTITRTATSGTSIINRNNRVENTLTSSTGTLIIDTGAGQINLGTKLGAGLILIKEGLGKLWVNMASNNANDNVLTTLGTSGKIVVNGGELRIGNDSTTTDSNSDIRNQNFDVPVVINDGATVVFDGYIVDNNGSKGAPPITVNQGGTLRSNSFFRVNGITLNGGMLMGKGGYPDYNNTSGWGSFLLYKTVKVTASGGSYTDEAPLVSTIAGDPSNFDYSHVRLGGYDENVTFDVDAGAKLLITARVKRGATSGSNTYSYNTGFIKIGLGVMEIANATNYANDYTGASTVNEGKLIISGNNSSATGAININNAGSVVEIVDGGLISASSAINVGSGAVLSFNRTLSALEVKGAVSGAGDIEKNGTQTVTLSNAASTITGALRINAGTLQISSTNQNHTTIQMQPGAIFSGSVTLSRAFDSASPATTQSFAGHEKTETPYKDITGSLTIPATTQFRIGENELQYEELRVGSGLALNGGTIVFDMASVDQHDEVIVDGSLTFGSGTQTTVKIVTSGGILRPASSSATVWTCYNLFTNVDPLYAGEDGFSGVLANFRLEGLVDSPSIERQLGLSDDKKTVQIWVKGSGVSYKWKGELGAKWGNSDQNWEDSSDDGMKALPDNGVVFLSENEDDTVERKIEIVGPVLPLDIQVEGISGDTNKGGYTITATKDGIITGTGGILKNSVGILTLTAASDAGAGDGHTFTGTVSLTDGKLLVDGSGTAVPVIANKGQPSLLGAGSAATSIILDSKNQNANASLILQTDATGIGDVTTDRSFTVGAGGGTLEVNGGKRVHFTGKEAVKIMAGSPTLTLGGAGKAALNLKLEGSLKIKKTGEGVWWLTGDANTFTGDLTVSKGTLALMNTGAVGSGAIFLSGGTLSNMNFADENSGISFTFAHTVTVAEVSGNGVEVLRGSTLTLGDSTTSGLTGAGALTKKGEGVLRLASANAGYNGALEIAQGTVLAAHVGALANSKVSVGPSGTLALGSETVEVAKLTGTGSVRGMRDGGATLNINIDNGETTFDGNFADGELSIQILSVKKTGEGTLILSGSSNTSNTHTGVTSVTNGVLVLGSIGVVENSSRLLASATGTLNIGSLNLGGKTAEIAGEGYAGKGALLAADTGVLPKLLLSGNATVRGAGTETLVTAGAAGSARHTLTLAAAGAEGATYVFEASSGTAALAGIDLRLAEKTTLVLNESGVLAANTALTLDSGSVLDLGATQTLAAIQGAGSVAGAGTLVLDVPAGKDYAFNGTLGGQANLTVCGAGVFKLGNPNNTTTGVIRVEGGTLGLGDPLHEIGAGGAANDLLGDSTSTVLIRNGVLFSTAVAPSKTNRTFKLAGATSTLRGDGKGGLVLLPTSALEIEQGANHRLILSGSSAENRLDADLADPAGASLSLGKTGTGSWTVGGTNFYSGGTFIESGIIKLAADDALSAGGSLLLGSASANTSGYLQLNGYDQTLGGLAVAGIGTDNRVINGGETSSVLTLDIASGNSLYEGALGRVGDGKANDFSLVKKGAGTLTLNTERSYAQTFTYVGDTRVEAGVLALGGATRLASKNIIVLPGAQLDASALAGGTSGYGLSLESGQTLAAGSSGPAPALLGNITLNGGVLAVGLDAFGNTALPSASALALSALAAPAQNTNILNAETSALRVRSESILSFALSNTIAGANSRISLREAVFDAPATVSLVTPDGTLAIGSYALITYQNRLSGFENLRQENSPDPRYAFAFVNDEANKTVLLNVSSSGVSAQIVWDGGQGAHVWDASTRNFFDDSGAPVAYFPGDSALFDDSAAFFDITVGADVSIGSVTFHNNNYDYTVSGGPIRGEGWLEKRGAASLTLDSANEYNGILREDGTRSAGTILAGGALIVGDDRALGLGSLLVSGAGATLSASGNITLANDIELAAGVSVKFDAEAGDALRLAGALKGAASTRIVKTGEGLLALAPDGGKFSGVISAEAGVVALDGADYSGAALELEKAGAVLEVSGVSKAGALRGAEGTLVRGASGALEVGAQGGNSNFAGAVEGGFALVKKGAGVLALSGDNSAHTGAVSVEEGRLQIGDGLSGTAGAGAFSVSDGAVLVLNLPEDAVFAQEISGGGVFEKAGATTLVVENANGNFSGVARVTAGALVLSGAGALGSASAQVSGELILARVGDYELPNDVSGTGTLVKTGGGEVAWLGTGSVNVRVAEGVFSVGDGAAALEQENRASFRVENGAALRIAPADGGVATLGDIRAEAGATVEKTGDGRAVLAGLVDAAGGLSVAQGELFVGDGGGLAALEIAGAIDVAAGATLGFNRARETSVSGKITGAGAVLFSGGTTVLLNAANELGGGVEIASGAVLQVGDAANAGSLGNAVVAVSVAEGGALRFAASGTGAAAATGANLALSGAGLVERRGAGELRFNGDGAAFTGTFSAAEGVFVFDAAALPAGAVFDATGAGVLRIESAAPSARIKPVFGGGDGVILLSSAPGVSAAYALGSPVSFGGTLAVDAATTLRLSDTVILSAAVVEVRAGAVLDGAGVLGGTLRNGGTLAPNASGVISLAGDFIHDGLLVVEVTDAGVSTLEYAGVAKIGLQGKLQLKTTEAILAELESGREIRFLRDTDTADGRAEIDGNFQPQNITVSVDGDELVSPALSYNAGNGWFAMILSENIGDIPAVRQNLHSGLEDYVSYLNATLQGGDAEGLAGVVGAFLNAPARGADIGAALNAASPLGFASITGMSISSAHDDASSLHTHLEATRFMRGLAREPVGLQPYFSGTGNFEQNAGGRDGAAYDFQIFGATAGLDYGIGEDFLVGLSAAFHNGRATLDDSAGKVNQETARLGLYATTMLGDKFYIETGVNAGYSGYNIKHRTIHGEARAKPEGYDFGASALFGGVISFSDDASFYITPYTGLEYAYAHVDAFTETDSAAALQVDGFKQESLRYKLGAGLSWFQRSNLFASVRWSLNLSYAYEFLGNDLTLNSRFAADTSGRSFRARTASYGEHVIQAGPSVDVAFTERVSVQIGYQFETDMESQSGHHFNATFRMRF
jgi:autotransporter-associated beta strand protein